MTTQKISAKKNFPPNNPLFKESTPSLYTYIKEEGEYRGEEGGRESEGRGEKRGLCGNNEYLYCRCPQCLGANYLAYDYARPPKYSKCQQCGELILTATFRMMIGSNEPLSVPRTATGRVV